MRCSAINKERPMIERAVDVGIDIERGRIDWWYPMKKGAEGNKGA